MAAAVLLGPAAAAQPLNETVEPLATPAPLAEGYAGAKTCSVCHKELHESFLLTKHGQAADVRTPFAQEGCETCHGPSKRHIALRGSPTAEGLIRFGMRSGIPPSEQNGICLRCHERELLHHWRGGAHQMSDVVCAGCHSVHGHDDVRFIPTQPKVCYRCHQAIRVRTHLAYGHPIRQERMACSECHNPHGSPTPALLVGLSINETCYNCHAELRGPYLWEHPPASEDCTLCHRPHGSNNPSLLFRRPPHLCQMCHQAIRPRHASQAYGADRSRFVLGASCLNCHSQVHGSNHPSGFKLTR